MRTIERVNFNVKMEKDTRAEFVKLTKQNDENASRVVRAFMKSYIAKQSK